MIVLTLLLIQKTKKKSWIEVFLNFSVHESEQDLVGSSGIFAKVLTKCKIDTFNSCLTYTPEGGYKVWFTLHLSYQHFNGGSNGMGIASFWFENGEWTMSDYKDENEEK